MSALYIVTKGPDKGFVGYQDRFGDHGVASKGKVLLYFDDAQVVVSPKSIKPAGTQGDKLVIDKQIKTAVNGLRDLMNRKKRLDNPPLTDKDIKKLLECIDLDEV